MKPSLLCLLLAAPAACQRALVPVSASTSNQILHPDWYLQNMSMHIPYYEPNTMLPPDIISKQASISFYVLEKNEKNTSILPMVVACNGTWDPWFPLQDLTPCVDEKTYWRFAIGQFWEESSFWMDFLRPSFLPKSPSTNAILQLVYAPIHITATMLHCTSVRLAGQIDTCVMENHKVLDGPSNGTVPLVRRHAWADEGVLVALHNLTAHVGAGARRGANFLNMTLADRHGAVQCVYAPGPGGPLPDISTAPGECGRRDYMWTLDGTGIGKWGMIRVLRKVEAKIGMEFVKRPKWDVDWEVVYEVGLGKGGVEWKCSKEKCEGRTVGGAKRYFLDETKVKARI